MTVYRTDPSVDLQATRTQNTLKTVEAADGLEGQKVGMWRWWRGFRPGEHFSDLLRSLTDLFCGGHIVWRFLETWCLSRGTAAADAASIDASFYSSLYLICPGCKVVTLKMICYFSEERVNWGFGLSIAVVPVDTAHPLYGFSGSSWLTTRCSDFMESRHCELCQWNFADTYKQTGFRVDRSYLAASELETLHSSEKR